MEHGKVSTNIYLRRLHNFALGMNWLPVPVIPRKQWPDFRFKEKRAITLEEHKAIVARETNAERKAFYELAWHLGASQSDIAVLEADNVDWQNKVISYARKRRSKSRSFVLAMKWRQFCAGCQQLERSFPICGRFVRATARRSSSKGARDLVSRA